MEGSWERSIIGFQSDDYRLFNIYMDGQDTTLLGVRYANNVRGIGGWATAANMYTFEFAASVSGDTWTFAACSRLFHSASGTHGTLENMTVTGIVGVL